MVLKNGYMYKNLEVFYYSRLSTGQSSTNCMRTCLVNQECYSFNYNKLTKWCYLGITEESGLKETNNGKWAAGYRKCVEHSDSSSWGKEQYSGGRNIAPAPVTDLNVFDSSSTANVLAISFTAPVTAGTNSDSTASTIKAYKVTCRPMTSTTSIRSITKTYSPAEASCSGDTSCTVQFSGLLLIDYKCSVIAVNAALNQSPAVISSSTRVCDMGLIGCNGSCLNGQTDNNNCGTCGNTCAAGKSCSVGACRCPTGQTDCSGVCKTLQDDFFNCGACSKVCATGATCSAGVCMCPAGEGVCNGACQSFQSDANNCGACATVCATGATCSAGLCSCPDGQGLCNGACQSFQSDTSNCGACGIKCGTGALCSAGVCTCPAGQTLCSGVCKNLQTDNNNCGTCSNVCSAGSCTSGLCGCPAGQTLCSGVCRDLQTSATNCGACGNSCLGGGSCSAGVCTCGAGYYLNGSTCFACDAKCARCSSGGSNQCLACAGGGVLDGTSPNSCSCPAGTTWSDLQSKCL